MEPSHCSSTEEEEPLDKIIAAVGTYLPAQGPIEVFVHHNPLHAFEHQHFEEAVAYAAERFRCEPYLSEERYRKELAAGRIGREDLIAVLNATLGSRAQECIRGTVTRLQLRLRMLIHGIPEARGPAIRWLLRETELGSRFRRDLPREAWPAGVASGQWNAAAEAAAVQRLWRACLDATRRVSAPPPRPERWIRHRDALLAMCGIDTDEWTHPLLIRFLSAYLDQGLAFWTMPQRELGLYRCFLALYGLERSSWSDPNLTELMHLARADAQHQRSAADSLLHSLATLGVPPTQWKEYLIESALALRGWAGMVRQLEQRPDRAPVHPPPASLLEFLAVRLLVERVAIADAARRGLGFQGALGDLMPLLSASRSSTSVDGQWDFAWQLFHVAQFLGLDGELLSALPVTALQRIADEVREFSSLERRRVFHLAYERRARHAFFDALAQHTPRPRAGMPSFQALFCLDEREESIRRHLEEVEPAVETFGTAGFFGVAMNYRGLHDAYFAPLCPVSIRPSHWVEEIAVAEDRAEADRRKGVRQAIGHVQRAFSVSSHTLVRGTLLTMSLGTLAVIPLVLRVLFPRFTSRLFRLEGGARPRIRTRLALKARAGGEAEPGRGFRCEEMADIVARVLEDTGLSARLAPLVLVIGHGSTSLNNPHESAHDCGACGGGRGGPNARAFAAMANDPEVRARLGHHGIRIPDTTWFVGAEHNTCSDSIEYFDEDSIPPSHQAHFEAARSALRRALRRNAHERCRRFDAWLTRFSSDLALAHVQARAHDLAQPRPEYGHATNAYCVIGRRERTRGLFLDRRAFLVSYDPTRDPQGRVLSRLLAAVIPVVAGINLEYWFGYVDPTGYGCGTKLPHNVTALLGVMDGAQSDLRPGLPWQMVEIHEPVRLTVVVEATVDTVQRALADQPAIRRLVDHAWIYLAALDPRGSSIVEISGSGIAPYVPRAPLPFGGSRSRDWCEGRADHLPIAVIGGEIAEGSR